MTEPTSLEKIFYSRTLKRLFLSKKLGLHVFILPQVVLCMLLLKTIVTAEPTRDVTARNMAKIAAVKITSVHLAKMAQPTMHRGSLWSAQQKRNSKKVPIFS